MKNSQKQFKNDDIIVERVSLVEIKKDRQLLNNLIDYIYDYFYTFENTKINKRKLIKILFAKLEDKNNLYFIIKKNNANIGMVHTYLSRKYVDLCLIYLDKQFRGQGVGVKVIKYLKKYFKQKLKKNHSQFFRIEIQVSNFYSHRFFQKLRAKMQSIMYLLAI